MVFYIVQFCIDTILKSELICDTTWSEVFKGTLNKDIVIIGNSRAKFHYNPNVITEKTNLSCYNLGLSGTPINVFDIRWKSFVNRNTLPKSVIIDVDYNFLGTANGLFEKFQYLPYVNEAEYAQVTKTLDKDLIFDQYIPCFKYQGQVEPLIAKFKTMFDKDCLGYINGYRVNTSVWDENEWLQFKNKRFSEVSDPEGFDGLYKEGVKKLNGILQFCQQKDIKVTLIWSPQYIEMQKFKVNQRQYVDRLINTLAIKYKIDYLNFSNNAIVYDKANFYNHSHLNYKGALEFSKQVGDYLKNKPDF